MRSNRFAARLAPGAPPLLLDGAMGTALQVMGLAPTDLPEAWLLARPEAIGEVHRAHVAAGARLLLTCTFNAAAPRAAGLLGGGLVRRACLAAAALARLEADGADGVLVAGALGPRALARPGGPVPPEAELARPFLPALQALVEGGVDLLWLETQYDQREALAALRVAVPLGLPVVLTYALHARDGRLLAADGTPAEALLREAAAAGAAAAGVNCAPAGPALTALTRWAASELLVPFVAKPSPGLPGAVLPPAPFADAVAPAIEAGARLVGGCCGATAEHVAALARRMDRGRAPWSSPRGG